MNLPAASIATYKPRHKRHRPWRKHWNPGMTEEDAEELAVVGAKAVRALRQRAKGKGVSLDNIACLSYCAVKSSRPDKFRLHFIGLSKKGALVLFNHTKEDIVYQLAEWTMTNGDWTHVCRCVQLLIRIRYGKHGAWANILEDDLQWVSKSLEGRILHIAAKKGGKRLRKNPQYLAWARENVNRRGYKHPDYDIARWFNQCHSMPSLALSS